MVELKESVIYCPVCGKNISASNIEEVERGEHVGYIFIHDRIDHEESDIDALQNGVQ